MKPTIEIKIIDKRLLDYGLPEYKTDGSAAIDMRAIISEDVVIPPLLVELIPSGIAININDKNIAAVLLPRSGTGHKEGIVLGNNVGLIDSDYQGEIFMSVWNRNPDKAVKILPGERIAQLMFIPVIHPNLMFVDEFSKATDRGANGFGHTGKL